MEIGQYHTLKMLRDTSIGIFLGNEKGQEILLPNKYVPNGIRLGDTCEVFVYLDNEGRLIATTLEPKIKLHEFASLKVSAATDKGAFLEWGIAKELFVPFSNMNAKMQEGRYYVVYMYVDSKTGRLTASAKVEHYLERNEIDLVRHQEVDILAYEETDLGYKVIIDNKYKGMVYKNEIFKPIFIGFKGKAYVKQIREDNKIDLSLQKLGVKGIETAEDVILQKLKEHQGFLQLTDKSSTDEIANTLGMSKKSFKKGIGGLFKKRLVTLEETGVRMVG